MRKISILFSLFLLSLLAKAQQPTICGTDFLLNEQKKSNPDFEGQKAAFDQGFKDFLKTYDPAKYSAGKKGVPKYIIPVVVHVFHANGSENISDAAIMNTIANMNKYYNGTVSGINRVRPIFKGLIADCEIEFRLAKKDPNGNCTNGIVHKYSTMTNRGNDNIKGLSVWDTRRYLNIWVAASVYSGTTAVGGYAYLPFGGGLTSKNGVLVVASQFISDNTGAHEAGHWLGLYHPFQSSDSCSTTNDECDDTPPTYFAYSKTGVNTGRGDHCGDTAYNSCTTSTPINTPDLPDMQENIMDYFSGSCSGLMFTWQQKARMHYCLTTFRKELIDPTNLIATGTNDITTVDCAPIAAFNTKSPYVCAGGSTNFLDYSFNASSISNYTWEFTGGTPSTATGKVPPAITYNTEGTYPVKLTVTNSVGSGSTTYTDYIMVKPASSPRKPGWRATADWWYQNNYTQDGWRFESDYSTSNGFQKSSNSYNNISSMMLPQDPFNSQNSIGNTFSLISPPFDFSTASNPYFAFNFAFARGIMFSNPTDESLNLYYSTTCGKTWVLAATKSGNNVSTIGTGTLASTINFEPSDATKWGEFVNGSALPKQSNVMFKISFKYNGGNNFYLDNVRTGDGAASGILENNANGINVSVHPNPFTNSTNLTYDLPSGKMVTVKIFDIMGKELSELQNGPQSAGLQTVLIDRNQLKLATGIYLITLNVDGERISKKIIIE